MEVILHTDGNNYKKIKEKLLSDEIVNRASIVFKEATQFGKESGYLCVVTGDEERCKRALELAKGEVEEKEKTSMPVETTAELAEEITGKEKEEILKKIKEEEDKAIEGFGGIFG